MKIKVLLGLMLSAAPAWAGTVSGNLLGPSGLPVTNGTLTFGLQQAGLIAGSGSVVPVTASCYTSTDGSVVGLPNPSAAPSTSIIYGSGTLAAGIYYVVYTFYDAAGNRSLASPELQVQLTGTGSLIIAPPATFPANAVGITAFVGTASGAETGQGNTVGATAVFTQASPPLTTATALPATNASVCSVAFNDTIIPYSGYNVALLSASGNAYPGWPQVWQLNGGTNGTVNISNGAPLWNGTVVYPTPLFSQPLNHGPQSISGLLNMSGYNVLNLGALGVGTSTPSFPVDVENGYINSNLGYLVSGHAGTLGQCLVSNGTYFGPGSCGTPPTIYYQHAQSNGSLRPQEPFLNFTPRFTAVDNAASTRTDVDLATTTVTAGSYTNANVTVDGYGRVIAATSGASQLVTKLAIINSGICTTGTSSYSSCGPMTITWTTPFADANYVGTCNTLVPTSTSGGTTIGVLNVYIVAKTATTMTIEIQNGVSNGAGANTVNEIDCTAIHP